MAQGTSLAVLRNMLKAQLGHNLTQGVNLADDAALNQLLKDQQAWLAGEYDWPHLPSKQSVTIAAGTRNGALPSMAWERPVVVTARMNGLVFPVEYGISRDLFNSSDNEESETRDPIERWQHNGDGTFEVWPIPTTEHVLTFDGQRALNPLEANTDTADLDDLLIVLWTAANRLASYAAPDASAKLQQAQARMKTLQAIAPKPSSMFGLSQGGEGFDRPDRRRPMVVSIRST